MKFIFKRFYYYSFIILITTLTVKNIYSQNIEKKEFKKANTIRLYVNDSSKQEAIERFADFINKTGFQAYIIKSKKTEPEISNQRSNSFQLNQLNNEPGLLLNNRLAGDTITTSTATLYDIMMGAYTARLKFYVSKDKVGKLYIGVTGYVSSNAFSIKFIDLKMQKGGKGSNWAQRDLFKSLNKHLLNYTDVYNIMYSVE